MQGYDGHVQEYNTTASLQRRAFTFEPRATLWPSHRLREEGSPSPLSPYDTHPPTLTKRGDNTVAPYGHLAESKIGRASCRERVCLAV